MKKIIVGLVLFATLATAGSEMVHGIHNFFGGARVEGGSRIATAQGYADFGKRERVYAFVGNYYNYSLWGNGGTFLSARASGPISAHGGWGYQNQ